MIRQLSTLLLCATLTACGSDSTPATNSPDVGRLMINGVEGLSYTTQSQSGKTNARGEFNYYPGETISFSFGNLVIASDVPTKQFLTFMEFSPAQRLVLEQGVVEEGLTVHKSAEKAAVNDPTINNIVRTLILLDDDKSVKSDKRLKFTDRALTQIDAAIAALPADKPVDFSIAVTDLTADGSWLNLMLGQICFYEATDERCETPPTQEEIDTLRATDEDAAKELDAKKKRIENGRRAAEQIVSAVISEYVSEQANIITTEISLRYALDPSSYKYAASDRSIKKIKVYAPKTTVEIVKLEARSNNENIATVQRFDAATGEVEFFATGAAGEETDIVVNFQVAGDYRWIRKTIRIQLI